MRLVSDQRRLVFKTYVAGARIKIKESGTELAIWLDVNIAYSHFRAPDTLSLNPAMAADRVDTSRTSRHAEELNAEAQSAQR
ncbi:hypothetical protein CA85_24860 [Allorhodopirellula solitaria]|uniref:Uncharacterized protein n=1 Tax=Allorhodopirellula solitaria TaxID=2527987 RepID=A0A5C5XXT9_9BACT|nr:hypothetical protein CA85_24860 [Allorhodopirellula solitaria]